jgi:hypothetical protein
VNRFLAVSLGAIALMGAATSAQAIVYTQDTTLNDFTPGTPDFATFSDFKNGGAVVLPPFTPSDSTLHAGDRFYDGTYSQPGPGGLPTNDWMLASFSDPEASIRVFANIDHPTVLADVFQWQIWGCSGIGCGTGGGIWTDLFDPKTANVVAGKDELGTGIGLGNVSRVNNTLFVGPGVGPAGTVGYVTDLTFSKAYQLFAFGGSDLAMLASQTSGFNARQEISAVTADVPLPGALSLFVGGLAGLGVLGRLRKRRMDSAQN